MVFQKIEIEEIQLSPLRIFGWILGLQTFETLSK